MEPWRPCWLSGEVFHFHFCSDSLCSFNFKVGQDKGHKSLDTRLLYVTTGILKRMLIAKKHLNEWTHVILDEVHEREEDMDVVMLICKKLLLTNSRGTKLILMSATLDQSKFQSYFASLRPESMTGPGREDIIKAPIINLDTRRDGIVQVKVRMRIF